MNTLAMPVLLAPPRMTCALAARSAARRWQTAALALTIGGAGLGLRAWNMHAAFESSDQAAMAHMLSYSYGLKWIAAHDYGPVLPAIAAGWCRLLSWLRLPIDEAALRMPIVIMSLLQVGVTWLLMRRLGFSPRCSWAACAAAALLPPLISDAHYVWAYQTVWLLFASIAIWAALAWQADRRPWQLAVAAAALLLHCLSSLYSYALPITLLVMWGWHLRSVRARDSVQRDRATTQAGAAASMPAASVRPPARDAVDLRAFLIAWLLPCAAALAVIATIWRWTGRGQLGRLLRKHADGAAGLHLEQLLELPRLWCSQLGPVFGAICAVALALGLLRLGRADRRALPALWATISIGVYTLLADWDRIGYAPHYAFEATFAAALVGAAWLAEAVRSGHYWRFVAIPLALAVGVQSALAGIDVGRPDLDLRAMTGIRSAWGEVRADSGIKAAGYYVRRFVPADATVLSLHTRNGMELPVAEYYCGRKVLAHHDLPERLLPGLWDAMRDRVDVVVIEPAQARLIAGSDLRCVAMLRRGGRVVRMVLARPELELPRRDAEVSVLSAAYDRECVPRRVPMALPAPPDFLEDLAHYKRTIADLRARLIG